MLREAANVSGRHRGLRGAHYWAREIAALGHEVRLIPPAYVKPFVKRGKTDAADADAISEAVTCKTMRFVQIKSAEQQAAAMVLKTRGLLVRQQTQAINALRAHLAELGIVAGIGTAKSAGLIEIVRDETDARLPKAARFALSALADQIEALKKQVDKIEREIVAEAKRDEDMRRLATIPGVGAITAATIKALVADPGGFKSGRHFAAWLGLTPKSHSSGGKERLGGISKMGNPELRTLLVLGATTVLRYARGNDKALPPSADDRFLRVARGIIDQNCKKEGAGGGEQGNAIDTSGSHAVVDRVADDQRDEKLRAGEDQHRGNGDDHLCPVGPDEGPDAPDDVLVESPAEHLLFDAVRSDHRARCAFIGDHLGSESGQECRKSDQRSQGWVTGYRASAVTQTERQFGTQLASLILSGGVSFASRRTVVIDQSLNSNAAKRCRVLWGLRTTWMPPP